VVASTSVGLTAQALCDDPDDPDEAVVAVERFVLSEEQFDQMVFGGARRVVVLDGGQRKAIAGQPSVTDFSRQMESLLENEIRAVDARCRLSEAQTKKLRLAGRGDIAQWLNHVSDLRKKCTGTAMDRQQYIALVSQYNQCEMSTSPDRSAQRRFYGRRCETR
jgi:hypothetical protein